MAIRVFKRNSGGSGVAIDPTFDSDFVVSQSGGRSFGIYGNGQTVPSKDKTAIEVLKMAYIESIFPMYVPATLALSQSAAQSGEVGEVLSNTLTATFAKNDAGNLTAIRIQRAGADLTPNGSASPFAKVNAVTRVLGNIAYQAFANYDAGPLKNVTPANTPDPRTPAIRTINAPQAAENDFASAVLNLNGFYPYFCGKVTSGTRPTPNQALIDSGTKVIASSAGTLIINFNSGPGDYIWFAKPTSQPLKNSWFVTVLNAGTIGGAVSPGGNLFPAPTAVDITTARWAGISYDIYVSNYPTTSTVNMELRN